MALLEVEDLRTAFHTEDGVVRAVDGVSFAVEAGKILGIVGESGCGKSVSAMSVMRLIPDPPGRIDGGRVLWKGRDLLACDPDEMPEIRGREIAMIFQDPMTSLNPVFTIRKQLSEVLEKRFGLRGEDAEERMVEVLGHVGIADASQRLGQYPHELSGGMKQRIMIAMSLMCKPDLLIADEPTTALDVTVQAQILQLMKQLQRESGTAIILITHDMGVVAETCDDVVVMYAGKVVESSSVFELFARPRHPYTRGLLDSILQPGRSKATPVPTIEGVVPSLIDPPAGCRFADRCGRVEDRCRQQDPVLAELEEGHRVACHMPLEAKPVVS
ncbi:MAG TPA: ABC transporter ATP-binding protein [Candidatus Latescibacteria bacterium]|jgi:oligopeptide/dipeptide ABC transporter ATP-binding protein|nr:peptide ABC transporter ATP-binding protein [Gemmatimonadaceae bacterium]MDP6014721.1 ABC transporter ATP-binding protein [Candidatus Latescibacterota bacterium]HJP29801.1 ABC transporter ATP-binding protein [Candidatus Latescibacterota bacterium]